MQENKLWYLHDSFGSYVDFKFDQHCFDATLALAIALNKTIEGMYAYECGRDK